MAENPPPYKIANTKPANTKRHTITTIRMSDLLISDDNHGERTRVTIVNGTQIGEFSNHLDGKPFVGTIIS